jgi:hypothetical protein
MNDNDRSAHCGLRLVERKISVVRHTAATAQLEYRLTDAERAARARLPIARSCKADESDEAEAEFSE